MAKWTAVHKWTTNTQGAGSANNSPISHLCFFMLYPLGEVRYRSERLFLKLDSYTVLCDITQQIFHEWFTCTALCCLSRLFSYVFTDQKRHDFERNVTAAVNTKMFFLDRKQDKDHFVDVVLLLVAVASVGTTTRIMWSIIQGRRLMLSM